MGIHCIIGLDEYGCCTTRREDKESLSLRNSRGERRVSRERQEKMASNSAVNVDASF